MTEIKSTSSMQYPLEEPVGYHLSVCEHQHVLEGQNHYVPVQGPHGAWLVSFRRNVAPGDICSGLGHNMTEAWIRAKVLAESGNGQ
jgi:predicted homoserine dehydrogenase-like protein